MRSLNTNETSLVGGGAVLPKEMTDPLGDSRPEPLSTGDFARMDRELFGQQTEYGDINTRVTITGNDVSCGSALGSAALALRSGPVAGGLALLAALGACTSK